jgi:hypothetical protein
VQVVIHVLSVNPEIDPDIASMIGASAALCVSGVPFNGPIGAARVGYANGQYILNPTVEQLKTSQMDLVVAGTETAVLMVESEAQQLSEEIMLGAVVFGHEMKAVIDAIHDLVRDGGKPEQVWTAPAKNEALIARVAHFAEAKLAMPTRPATSKPVPTSCARRRLKSSPTWRRSCRRGAAARTALKLATSCSTWNRRSCVRRSWTASHVSTAATPAPCVRSRSAPRCCHVPTVRPCSPVAKPRHWSLQPWAPPAIRRRSTR